MAGRQRGRVTDWAAAGPQTLKRKDYVLGLRQDRPGREGGRCSAGRLSSTGSPPQLKRCRPKWRQGAGEAAANRTQEERKGHLRKDRPATSLLTWDTPGLQMQTNMKAGPAPCYADDTLHRTHGEHTRLEKEHGTTMQDPYEVCSPSIKAQREGWSILHITN